MKEVLSVFTFAIGALGFVVFLAVLKPTAISAIQAAPDHCQRDSSGMRGCNPHVFAAMSGAARQP